MDDRLLDLAQQFRDLAEMFRKEGNLEGWFFLEGYARGLICALKELGFGDYPDLEPFELSL